MRRNRGFTLIELMVTVVIVAILGAIAYPSYLSHVIKTRRSLAAGCLIEHAQWMERNYTTCLAYDKTGAGCTTTVNTAALPSFSCKTDLTGIYSFAIEGTPAISGSTYLLSAAPVEGGPQASDTKCGKLTLNQVGTRGAAATSGCWK